MPLQCWLLPDWTVLMFPRGIFSSKLWANKNFRLIVLFVCHCCKIWIVFGMKVHTAMKPMTCCSYRCFRFNCLPHNFGVDEKYINVAKNLKIKINSFSFRNWIFPGEAAYRKQKEFPAMMSVVHNRCVTCFINVVMFLSSESAQGWRWNGPMTETFWQSPDTSANRTRIATMSCGFTDALPSWHMFLPSQFRFVLVHKYFFYFVSS